MVLGTEVTSKGRCWFHSSVCGCSTEWEETCAMNLPFHLQIIEIVWPLSWPLLSMKEKELGFSFITQALGHQISSQ